MTELTENERAVAAQQIHEVQLGRCLVVDTRDWQAHEALHAADFRSWLAERECWVEEGAKGYTERVARLISGRTSMHYVNAPVLTFESADKVGGVWAMQDRLWWEDGGEERWLHGFGFYHDTLARREGLWLFTSRKLVRTRVEMSGDPLG